MSPVSSLWCLKATDLTLHASCFTSGFWGWCVIGMSKQRQSATSTSNKYWDILRVVRRISCLICGRLTYPEPGLHCNNMQLKCQNSWDIWDVVVLQKTNKPTFIAETYFSNYTKIGFLTLSSPERKFLTKHHCLQPSLIAGCSECQHSKCMKTS